MMRSMEPVATPDAVVFDNDGLLLDTESVWTRAEQDLFDRRGTRVHPRRQARAGRDLGRDRRRRARRAPRRARPRGGADRGAERARRRRARARGGGDGRRARAAADAARARHADRPRLQLAARLRHAARCSSSASRTIFDVVLSAHEVAAPKPAPDPYLEACRRLGVEPGPGVVALEDSPTGVAAARAAGLTVIGVPSIEGVALEEAHHLAESLLDEVVADRLAL